MSFFAYLLYLALTFLRPTELFWPDLEEYRPMLWLWLFAFLSALVSVAASQQFAARRVNFLLLGLLVVTVGASVAVNSSFSGALEAVSAFSTSAMLFVLTCMNLTSTRRVRIACNTILACMLACSVMGIVSYHYGWMAKDLVLQQGAENEVDVFEVNPDIVPAEDASGQFLWRVRSLGFLNDPNDFAQALVMVLPLLWRFYAKRHAIRNLLVVLAPTSVLAYTIYLTHSRGAAMGSAAMVLFAARRRLGVAKTGALALTLFLGASLVNVGSQREFSTKEESAGDRIEAWYAGLQMLKTKPILGVGYGNFLDHHPLTAHNSAVLCFAELGIIGYFLWVALLVLAFRELAQVLRRTPMNDPDWKLASALTSALVGFLVCAWFLSRTYQPLLYLLLALCACAAWCARRDAESGSEAVSWGPPIPWVVPTLLADLAGIAAVYGFVTVSRLAGG